MASDARFERTLLEVIARLERLSEAQLTGRDKWLAGARKALANLREQPQPEPREVRSRQRSPSRRKRGTRAQLHALLAARRVELTTTPGARAKTGGRNRI